MYLQDIFPGCLFCLSLCSDITSNMAQYILMFFFSFLLFQVTLYYQGLRVPFTLPLGPSSSSYETRDITAWNFLPEIASQIAQEDQCKYYLYDCLMRKQCLYIHPLRQLGLVFPHIGLLEGSLVSPTLLFQQFILSLRSTFTSRWMKRLQTDVNLQSSWIIPICKL